MKESAKKTKVALIYHDIDKRDDGKYYGVAIKEISEEKQSMDEDKLIDALLNVDPIEVAYAQTEDGAYRLAEEICEENHFIII